MIKYFRFSYDYVLWDIGYMNLSMLQATIPRFETEEKKKQKEDEKQEAGVDDDLAGISNFLNIQ